MKTKKEKKNSELHQKKKHKKEKHIKKKVESSSSSSSDSESGNMEWVETSAAEVKPSRDAWMEADNFVRTLDKGEMKSGMSRRDMKRQEKEQKRQEEETIYQARELNPNLRKAAPPSAPSLPTTSVGDGGYAYLRKAHLRIREQAQAEGKSMEEVAQERWGSLERLESMIEQAKERMNENASNKYDSAWKNERKSRGRDFRKPSHRSPSPENSIRFERPKDYQRNRSKLNFSSSKNRRRYDDDDGNHSREYSKRGHKFSRSPDKSSRRSRSDSRDRSNRRSGSRDRSNRRSGSRDRSNRRSGSRDRSYRRSGSRDRSNRLSGSRDRSNRRSGSRDRSNRRSGSHDASPRRPDNRTKSSSSFSKKEEHVRVPAWKKKMDRPREEKSMSPNSPKEDQTDEPATPPPPTTTQPTIQSEDDLNRLAAKYLKAELMGDTDLTQRLKAELDEARQQFYENGPTGNTVARQGAKEVERVVLTKMDSGGQQRPIVSGREDGGFERRDGHKKKSRKYVDDSSRYTLKQMFQREKLTTTDDNLDMFVDVAAECRESDNDDETSGINSKASHKMSHSVQEERDIGRAMQQNQRMSAAIEKCEYCMDQPKMQKHLVVTIGEQFYLALPNFVCLTKGHCLIVPKHHVTSFLALDEDARRELEELQHQLRRFFASQGQSVIFLETSMNFKWCPHAYRECIPVPLDTGDMAPLYFKKALLESEEEWAQNVKLVDLTKKGLFRSIPKSFPYFCVLFDPALHGGYAHVIEDERTFPRNFGKEVVGGMMDIDYDRLYKNRREKPLQKSEETHQFTEQWEAFQRKEQVNSSSEESSG